MGFWGVHKISFEIKIINEQLRFFETIGPSLFSLGPRPKDGPEKIEQSPK
jgi:hypothetical protein